jgi:hypothetical protein
MKKEESFGGANATPVMLLILGCVFLYSVGSSFSFQFTRYILAIGGTQAEAGYAMGATFVVDLIFMPLAAYLCTVYPIGRIVMAGLILFAAANSGLLFIDKFGPWIYAVRSVQGAGNALAYIPLFSGFVHLLPDQRKAQGIAYFGAAATIGSMVGGTISSIVFENFHSAVWIVSFAASLLVALCPAALLQIDAIAPSTTTFKQRFGANLALLRDTTSLAGLAVLVVLGGVYATLIQFVPTWLDYLYVKGITEIRVSNACFVTPLLFAILSTRLGIGQIGDGRFRQQIIFFGFIVSLIALQMVGLIRSPVSAILVGALFGIGYGVFYPTFTAFVIVNARGKTPMLVGALATSFQVGFLGLPMLIGPSIQSFGFDATFRLVGVAFCLAWLFYLAAGPAIRTWITPRQATN